MALTIIIIHIILVWILSFHRGKKERIKKLRSKSISKDKQPVSIIIPAWCEQGTIEACIRSLKTLSYPYWEAVILAGGPDGTYQVTLDAVAGDNRFLVLERGPEPKNAVINRGIEAAKYDFLALLDADSIVESEWLSALVLPLLNGASASYGFFLPQEMTWISINEQMIQLNYHIFGAYVAAGCASIGLKREVFKKIGPLTVDAYSWEDWDLFVRVKDSGGSIVPATDARLITDRPTNLKEFWNTGLRACRTHIAGLWYHRKIFLKKPLWAFYELLFLGLATFFCIALIASIITIAINPMLAETIISVIGLFALWIFARRAALVAVVSTYKNENKWLKRFWSPILLLAVMIPCAFLSVLTVNKQPKFDYKGPRKHVY